MKSAVFAVAHLALGAQGIALHSSVNESICQSEDISHRMEMQMKTTVFGVECEAMCKKMGIYPNCQCGGFDGEKAFEGNDVRRLCHDQYCQDPKAPCPTDNFVICVKENTKVSTLLQWDVLLQKSVATAGSCQMRDANLRTEVYARLLALAEPCEDMCKKMGIYPNCQCGGFGGEKAFSGDQRMCIDKYCQDPKTPCPTDNFVICVKENTKVATLLQWNVLIQHFDAHLGLEAQPALLQKAASTAKSCVEQDQEVRAILASRVAALGPDCENMCRKMNIYPNCQCPGFAGNAASDGDQRACMDKYCQDPKAPCPSENFVICVKERTKTSLLQWDHLFQRFDAFIHRYASWSTAK